MTVTVNHKSVLQNHGNKSKEAAGTYRQEISTTERRIQVKIEGQQADAINAFVNKLNSISFVINESYPRILEDYSEIILNYVSNLEGMGFTSDTIKTKGGDIGKIKEWLSTTKAKEFLSKGDELSEATKVAIEALAMSPHPVEYSSEPGTYAYGVARRLTDLGVKREETHNELKGYFNEFKSKLDSINTQMEGIKGALKNAQFMHTLPVSEALGLISNSYLTTDNINHLDSIQAESDSEALKIILRERDYYSQNGENKVDEGFFTDLGSVKGSNISAPMMDIIYSRINKEFSEVKKDKSREMNNIRAFVYAIANQEQDDSSAYFENLVYAGDRYATVIGVTAKGMVPKLPASNASDEEFKKYDKKMEEIIPALGVFEDKLDKAGQLTSLFEALTVIGVGQNHQELRRQGSVSNVDKSISLSDLVWNQNGFTFKVNDKSNIWGKERKAEVTNYDTATGATLGRFSNELSALKEKREEVIQNFVLDLGKSVAGHYIPGASQVIDLVSSTLEQDGSWSSAVGLGNDVGEATFKDLYSDSLGKYAGGTQKLLSFYESLMDIKDQEIETKTNQKLTLFDVGGRGLSGVNGRYVKQDINYDLQAILKIDDMEKNGLRGYAYRNAGSNDINTKIAKVKEFEEELSQNYSSESKGITKETYKMFRGNSDKSVDDVGIANISDGLDWVQDNITDTNFHMTEILQNSDGSFTKDVDIKNFETEDYAVWGNKVKTVLWPN